MFWHSSLFAVTPEEQMAEDLCWLHLKAPVPSLDGIDKAEVIRILRDIEDAKIRKIGRTIVSSRGAQIALLRLGDDQTLRETVETFRSYDSRYSLDAIPKAIEYAHPPKMIALLAEDFFREEDPAKILRSRPQLLNPGATGAPQEAAIIVPPMSVYAGVIAMRIIMKEPSFTPELREWADSMIDMRINDVENFQKTMRGWWIANREHFEAGNYHLVTSATATEEIARGNPSVPGTPDETKSISSGPAMPAPPVITEPKVPPQEAPVVPEPQASIESIQPKSPRWLQVLAGVIAVGFLVFLARYSSRHRMR